MYQVGFAERPHHDDPKFAALDQAVVEAWVWAELTENSDRVIAVWEVKDYGASYVHYLLYQMELYKPAHT